MLEVHRNVVASDVRGHGDDRSIVELSDEMRGGDTIKVRHDNVHQDEVVFGSSVDFVHRFQPVQLNLVSITLPLDRIFS